VRVAGPDPGSVDETSIEGGKRRRVEGHGVEATGDPDGLGGQVDVVDLQRSELGDVEGAQHREQTGCRFVRWTALGLVEAPAF